MVSLPDLLEKEEAGSKKRRLAPKGRVTRMFIVSRPAPTTSLVTFNCLLLSSQRTQHRANLNTPDNGIVLGISQEGGFQRSITFPYLVMFGCGSAITTGVQSHSHSLGL